MEKRKQWSRQVDIFARDPDRMCWEYLPAQERGQTQTLFAKLAFDVFSQLAKGQKHKGIPDERKNHA